VTMRAIAKYVAAVISLCSCTAHTIYHTNAHVSASVHLARALNVVLSWPSPANVNALRGAVLIRDGPKVDTSELAIARAMLRTNPRLTAGAALLFAGATVDAANAHGLPPDFLAATLLQESAYDPNALSSAGAIGIAQFMPETAAGAGVDPYDPFDSIEGAAALLGGYAGAYAGRYADPYTAALAAYNAGPLAVEHYGGIPPYPETLQYVALIFDRWARIVSYEHGRAP
jgi:soluble lytic murein transglycosylase-like protein